MVSAVLDQASGPVSSPETHEALWRALHDPRYRAPAQGLAFVIEAEYGQDGDLTGDLYRNNAEACTPLAPEIVIGSEGDEILLAHSGLREVHEQARDKARAFIAQIDPSVPEEKRLVAVGRVAAEQGHAGQTRLAGTDYLTHIWEATALAHGAIQELRADDHIIPATMQQVILFGVATHDLPEKTLGKTYYDETRPERITPLVLRYVCTELGLPLEQANEVAEAARRVTHLKRKNEDWDLSYHETLEIIYEQLLSEIIKQPDQLHNWIIQPKPNLKDGEAAWHKQESRIAARESHYEESLRGAPERTARLAQGRPEGLWVPQFTGKLLGIKREQVPELVANLNEEYGIAA